MDELIEFLEENGVEVTDDLREEINNIWESNTPDTDDLFTQEELNEVVKKRLGREQKLHEQEIEDWIGDLARMKEDFRKIRLDG